MHLRGVAGGFQKYEKFEFHAKCDCWYSGLPDCAEEASMAAQCNTVELILLRRWKRPHLFYALHLLSLIKFQ